MSEADRLSALDAWLAYSVCDAGEAITSVETALGYATGATHERLLRAKSALLEVAALLDTVYPEAGLHSVRA